MAGLSQGSSFIVPRNYTVLYSLLGIKKRMKEFFTETPIRKFKFSFSWKPKPQKNLIKVYYYYYIIIIIIIILFYPFTHDHYHIMHFFMILLL